MPDSIDTALREFIEILKDRQWHDLYEFHIKYRLSAALIFTATDSLLRTGIIIKVGRKIKLADNLQNEHLSLINRLQKTKKPEVLNVYTRGT